MPLFAVQCSNSVVQNQVNVRQCGGIPLLDGRCARVALNLEDVARSLLLELLGKLLIAHLLLLGEALLLLLKVGLCGQSRLVAWRHSLAARGFGGRLGTLAALNLAARGQAARCLWLLARWRLAC